MNRTIQSFTLPPWAIAKPHIDLTLIQQEKTQPTTSSAKNRFKELRDKYSDHTAFYTDESKTVDGTGAAVTNINYFKEIRLPNIAIQPSSNPRGKPKPPIHTRDTRNISLSNFGKTVIFAWFPSHVGIKGNQMADTLTKEATKMIITTLKLPFTNYKTKIKHYIENGKQYGTCSQIKSMNINLQLN